MERPRFVVTDAVLSLDAVMTAVLTDSDRPLGAVSTFVGLVRRRNLDRDVLFLEYEAYVPLALKAFSRIEDEVAHAWPSAIVGIHHRIAHQFWPQLRHVPNRQKRIAKCATAGAIGDQLLQFRTKDSSYRPEL